MAKELSYENTFTVTIEEVPLERLGRLMEMLAIEDFMKVRNELVTTVATFKRNTVHRDVANEDFLRGWIQEHPTFKAIEAAKAFEADGRPRGGAYPAIKGLVETKELKKLGPAQYARADIKHLPAPNTANSVPNAEALMRYAAKHPTFTRAAAKAHLAGLGRNVSGIGTTLGDLMKQKKIKRTGKGEYLVIAHKTNGAAAEAQHG